MRGKLDPRCFAWRCSFSSTAVRTCELTGLLPTDERVPESGYAIARLVGNLTPYEALPPRVRLGIRAQIDGPPPLLDIA
jgi:hypothetical protein